MSELPVKRVFEQLAALHSGGKETAIVLALLISSVANSQEVSEIPFFNAPEGSAALGGGIRFGQSPYLASDNEDERQKASTFSSVAPAAACIS